MRSRVQLCSCETIANNFLKIKNMKKEFLSKHIDYLINERDFILGWLFFLLPFIIINKYYVDPGDFLGIVGFLLFWVGFMYQPIIIWFVIVIAIKLLTKFGFIEKKVTRIQLGLLFCVVMFLGFVIIHNKLKNTSPYCQYITKSVSERDKCYNK